MFERYVRFIVRHRRAVIAATALLVAAFAPALRFLHFEIRRRANRPSDDVYVKIQNRISDLFGGEAVVIIGAVATHGDIYTPQILGKVERITERVRDIPGVVDSSVFSLAAPHVKSVTTAADGSLDIHTLMNGEPESAEEIARIRDEVRRDRFFRGNLVSEDETATLVVGDFDDTLTDTQLAARVAAAVDPERDDSVVIALAGAPILRAALADYTKMIGILFPLAVFVIAVVHYEAFRTLQAMVLPLCTALLSVILALSLMGLLGLPMDTWSALTPVVILAIAARARGADPQALLRGVRACRRHGRGRRAGADRGRARHADGRNDRFRRLRFARPRSASPACASSVCSWPPESSARSSSR